MTMLELVKCPPLFVAMDESKSNTKVSRLCVPQIVYMGEVPASHHSSHCGNEWGDSSSEHVRTLCVPAVALPACRLVLLPR